MKRILFIVPNNYTEVGGYKKPIVNYGKQLSRQGYEINYIAVEYRVNTRLNNIEKNNIKKTMEGCDCVICFFPNPAYMFFKQVMKGKKEIKAIAYLADSMELNAKSIIKHSSSLKIKTKELIKSMLYHYREKKNLSYFNSVIYVSYVDAEYAKKIHQNAKSLIKVIPQGMSVPQNRIHYRTDNDNIVLGMLTGFSNDSFQNNVIPFITEIFPILYKRFSSIKLIIAGKGASEAQRKVMDTVEGCSYIGFVPKLSDFYGKINASIITVKKDCGLVNRILESWAYGVPVISFARNSKTILYEYEDAPVITADTPDEFIEGLNFLKDIDIEGFRERCIGFVSENYNWDISTNKLIHLMEDENA